MGFTASGVLIVALFLLLGAGVWIGLALLGVGWIGMMLFTDRPIVNLLGNKVWEASSSWTLTALPLFIWMGEILFRSKLSEDMFRGLAPWMSRLPGRLLHTNVVGCTIFAAISGSSAATCATIGRITIPELRSRGYPEHMTIGTLAGAGTLGLLIPPSIIMIVYGVIADVSIGKLFIAGIIPGLLLASLFSGYVAYWALRNPGQVPVETVHLSFADKIKAGRHLIPAVILIALVLGSIYTGVATATESAALGVIGALGLAAAQGSLTWDMFRSALMGATRLSCMIGLILAGAAFLTLAMGITGLPRQLAEWIDSLNLSVGSFIAIMTFFYIIMGCFLDGISMVVLTTAVLLPAVQKLNIDMVWFGIFVVIVVEMAQITPPVGFNLFVLQGMTGHQITFIARAALPLFLLMVAMVVLITAFPQIVTILPETMIGRG
ncbi:MAG: TRAP transporter large permease subunit [Alphaproteobacteria bacterium]|nr:TRAP transporter large permease subunit [Alphaproteobacteria bacterium]